MPQPGQVCEAKIQQLGAIILGELQDGLGISLVCSLRQSGRMLLRVNARLSVNWG